MTAYLTLLLPFQRFFIPLLLLLAVWGIWRTVFRRDLAVGLAFYLTLVIIVDGFLNTGLFIFVPGIEKGSIRFSEMCALFLFFNRPPVGARHWSYGTIRFAVGAYFTLLLVSTFSTSPVILGIFDFRREIVPQIVAFVVAMRGLRSYEDFRRFFIALTAFTVVIALFVFWDLFFDRWLLFSEMLNKPEYTVARRHNRFGAFFLNPNYLGTFAVLVFPGFFMWALSESRVWAKAIAGIGLLALSFCLVETQSRGPLLAFAASLPLLLLGPSGGTMSRKRRLAMFVPLVLVFTILMPGFFTRATQRFETMEEEMNTEGRSRQTTWQYTWMIISDNPIGGIGYGETQYITRMEEYGYNTEFGRDTLHHPHNAYLQMAVYAGLPALLAFLAANGLLLLQALLSMHAAKDQQAMTLGLMVGLIAFLAVIYPHNHMFVEKVATVYWVVFGLLLSLATRARAMAIAPLAVSSTFVGPTVAPLAVHHTQATIRPAPFN